MENCRLRGRRVQGSGIGAVELGRRAALVGGVDGIMEGD